MNSIARVTMLGVVFLLPLLPVWPASAEGPTLDTYQTAEAVRGDKITAHALNLSVAPIWVPHGDRFWFRQQDSQGWQFVAIDPDRRDRRAAFDHARLALAISRTTQQPTDAAHLDLQNLAVDDPLARRMSFETSNKRLTCDVASYTAQPKTSRPSIRFE